MAKESNIIEFRKAYKLPINTSPTLLTDKDFGLHAELIAEELVELTHAHVACDIVEVADAIADLRYVIAGLAVHMGLPLEAIESEVHASNMSKLGADGEPIFRDDGKVLKGPNFRGPRIKEILDEN